MAVKSGWPMTTVPYKNGTTVYASSCRVYKYLKSSVCTHRAVYSYIKIHMIDYISVRRVCKHVPAAPMIFPGSHARTHACTHARTHARTQARTHARTHTHTCSRASNTQCHTHKELSGNPPTIRHKQCAHFEGNCAG